MNQILSFLNGQILPASECHIPVYDGGFLQGVTVAEQQRTFNGRLFRLQKHIDRLFDSLAITEIDPGMNRSEFVETATNLTANNFALLSPGQDLGLCIFVTPGTVAKFDETLDPISQLDERPLVCMHTYPQRFYSWSHLYTEGQPLIIPKIREVPNACWSSALKCRSRMHYYLADKEAKRMNPEARALLLDVDGNVAEASTANVFMHLEDEGLVAPPAEKILPSISMGMIKEIAQKLGLNFTHRDISPDEIQQADEVMLCSTSPCVLPVSSINDTEIGNGQPGPVFHELISKWSNEVGVDIVQQAMASKIAS